MKLLLVRHGDTGPAFKGCYIGRTDVPLWPGGIDSVTGLADTVEQYRPQRCAVSPRLRARQTAELLLGRKFSCCDVDENLREVNFGTWEGCTFAEICRRDPDVVRRWTRAGDDFCFPEGDKLGEFRRRVVSRADHYASLDVDSVLLVTHGGVIRLMICHYLGIPLDKYLSFEVAPSTLTVLESFEKGSAVLKAFNLPGVQKDG